MYLRQFILHICIVNTILSQQLIFIDLVSVHIYSGIDSFVNWSSFILWYF